MDPPHAQSTQLEYAPPPPWHRRRHSRLALFGVVAVIIAAAVGWSAFRWWPDVRDRLQLLALQRRCMGHEWRPEAIAFQQDAAVDHASEPWKMRPAWATLPPWKDFHRRHVAVGPMNSLQSHGTLFLHRRTSRAGNERLVGVELIVSWFPDGTLLDADKRVIEPAGLWSNPVEVWRGDHPKDEPHPNLVGRRQPLMTVEYGKDLRLHHGRADPDDASHFTIQCMIDGMATVIDGWLRDDDTVKLEVRGQ